CETADPVDAGGDDGLEVGKDADAPRAGREAACARRVPVGDTHQHGAREPRHGVEVDAGDRPRADEADPEWLRRPAHAAGASGAHVRAESAAYAASTAPGCMT